MYSITHRDLPTWPIHSEFPHRIPSAYWLTFTPGQWHVWPGKCNTLLIYPVFAFTHSMLLAQQWSVIVRGFYPCTRIMLLPGTGIWHWKSDFMNKKSLPNLMLERDPSGSMVVQVHKHICDEVLHNAQTWSEWGNKTRAANVSRFRERHCAEVLLFDCTTQHSYCCPASTPNNSHLQALFQNLNKTPKVAKDLKSWQKPWV